MGDFQRSKKQYRLGLAKKTSYDETMIAECIAFISQAITRFPEKKQLQLALGILELHRESTEQAFRAFKRLLDNTQEEPELEEFVNEAKQLIKQNDFLQSKGVFKQS
jgi:hypothetical protein